METSAFRPVYVVVALRTGLPIHGHFSIRKDGNALRLGVPYGSQVVVEPVIISPRISRGQPYIAGHDPRLAAAQRQSQVICGAV